VLAHELSHVTQRHIARGVAGERGKNTAINILGLLLGVLAAAAPAAPTWRRPPSWAARRR
jgi:predicted Zn-dependent protease